MGLIYGIRYWLRLVREILASIIDVSKRCLNGDIDPCIVNIDTDVKNPLGQIMVANSITYTPGTVTIDIDREKRQYIVGAINPRGRADVIPLEPHVLGWLGE
jgi:energy-converting hydrogenase B subunit A